MKSLKAIGIISIIFLFIITVQGQSDLPIDEDSGLITYKDVVDQEGAPDELFTRALVWTGDYYKNPEDVIRNKEDNKIVGLHRFTINNIEEDGNKTKAGVIQYNFILEFKDGKYRYTLTDFVLKQASKIPVEKWLDTDGANYQPAWESYLGQIDEFAKDWIKNLKEGMLPKVEKEDDW
jgi:hypothetical protein